MDAGSMIRSASPFALGVIVGGLVWIVFNSLIFGFLAAAATGFLVNRDRKEDLQDEEERR